MSIKADGETLYRRIDTDETVIVLGATSKDKVLVENITNAYTENISVHLLEEVGGTLVKGKEQKLSSVKVEIVDITEVEQEKEEEKTPAYELYDFKYKGSPISVDKKAEEALLLGLI